MRDNKGRFVKGYNVPKEWLTKDTRQIFKKGHSVPQEWRDRFSETHKGLACHNNIKHKEKQFEKEFKRRVNYNTMSFSRLEEENKYGGLAARQNSNVLESIGVLSGNPVMEIRTEGCTECSQGQRIESEKIQSLQETPTTLRSKVEKIC